MFNSKFGIGVLKHPGYNMGGDPPAPTSNTSYTTNVPEYAQPYVENMLNAAQAQIFNPSMTGFNKYVPYSSNPADYVASASPMQQQAYSSAANMRVPGQYGMATRGTMGAMAGLGGVGNQMGNAGYNYAMQATNPYATQAYMNPYLQASLAPQLQLANQQYDIAGQQEQSKAAQQGAFGGSREALMGGLNRQNQMLAQNQIIGQGYNNAFNAAQQAQQFGANLGLQGQQGQLAALQAMLGGANQLAGIGGAELAAQQGIAGLQNQYGQQQQQQQQNIINQAVQNYATEQQYPFMQLGLMNSMLRGLPMQQSSTQMYQAPPSAISQMAGLGMAGLGASQMFGGKAKGGVIKAAGGIPMKMYSPQQLQQVTQSPNASPLAKLTAMGYQQDDKRLQDNPQAKLLVAQVPPRAGVDQISTPPDMTQMAGGGIIAFADGEEVPSTDDASNFRLSSQKEAKSSSDSPFILFGHPMNKAARDSEDANMVKANGLNWKDKIRPQAPVQESGESMSGFNQFMKDNDNRPSYQATEVTPQLIEAALRRQKENVPTKVVANPEAQTEATKAEPSDYDEIKQMLKDEFKSPSTKTADFIKSQLASTQKSMEERNANAKSEALMRAGLDIMAGQSPFAMVNIGKGAPAGLESLQKSRAASQEDQNLIDKYNIAGMEADEARHQAVGLNMLKITELEQAAKASLAEKIRALQQAQQNHQDSMDLKRILAASTIQGRNYKEESVKAEKSSQIGGAISMFDNTLKQIDKIQNHPGRYNGADVVGAAASHIPSSDAYDYKSALQGLKDTQFMSSIAGIKGTGIGRILLPEVEKIQNSTGVLDTHQSRAQFDKNLNNLRDMIISARRRAIGSANHYGITPEDLGITK